MKSDKNHSSGNIRTIIALILIIIGVFTIPIGIAFISIGILLLILKKHDTSNPDQNSTSLISLNHEASTNTNINISVSNYYAEKHIANGCSIDKIDFGRIIGEAIETYTWCIYEVSGIKLATNRKNKRQYTAICETHAKKLASNEGLTNIEIISVKPCEGATEAQLQTALDMGISIPGGVSSDDAKMIISRVSRSNDVVKEVALSKDLVRQFVRPIKSPTDQLARFAFEKGITFSPYISETALVWYVVNKLLLRDRLAFYAYCVVCDNNRERIGNLLDSPLLSKFYSFADSVKENESIVKSLEGRDVDDYLKPNKRTTVYRAYIDYSEFHK